MAAQLAAERGSQVSGLDASEDLLAIARSRVPTGDFRVGELEHLPFPDASFDLVTGFNSFQYAANPSAALAEAKRVARRGAKVVIMTWGEPEGMEAASLVAALRPAAVSPTWCPWAFCSFGRTNTAKFRSWRRSGASNTFRCRFALAIPGSSYCLRSSGVAAKAIEHSSTGAVDEAHVRALTPFRQLDGSYKIAATFRCLITRA
jgi:SAM-dependent methyltransferase